MFPKLTSILGVIEVYPAEGPGRVHPPCSGTRLSCDNPGTRGLAAGWETQRSNARTGLMPDHDPHYTASPGDLTCRYLELFIA